MSRKLVSRISNIPNLPAKYKRVLEAWAEFANNDGTNIYPSKEAVGKKKGINRRTVYRNTDALVSAGVLVPDTQHHCKDPNCTGPRHYWSNGHWTQVYRINLQMLDSPIQLRAKLCEVQKEQCDILTHCSGVEQCDILSHGQCDILSNSNVSQCHATQGSKETHTSLGDNDDSSALTSGVSKQVGLLTSFASLTTVPPSAGEDDERTPNEDQNPKNIARGESEEPTKEEEAEWQQLILKEPNLGTLEEEIGTTGGLAEAMGLPYFYCSHIRDLRRLAEVAYHGYWIVDDQFVTDLWTWAQGHKFWSKRIVDLKSLAKAMGNQTERGLVAQFKRRGTKS